MASTKALESTRDRTVTMVASLLCMWLTMVQECCIPWHWAINEPSGKMRRWHRLSVAFLLVLYHPLVLDVGLGLYSDNDGGLLVVRAGLSAMMIMKTTLRMSLAMTNRAIFMALAM